MKKWIFIILVMLPGMGVIPLQAQVRAKADRWFEQGAYHKALGEYCRLIVSESGTMEAGYAEFRAGVCCYRMNRYWHAREWFEKAGRLGYEDENLLFMLGEVMLLSGDYARADSFFTAYARVAGDDPLVEARLASCRFAREFTPVTEEVKVSVLPYLNTRGSEYGVSFVPGGILYSSTGDLLPEKHNEVSQRTGMGYSHPYLSLLMDGEYEPGKVLKGIGRSTANEGSFAFDAVNRQLYCTRCEDDIRNCRIIIARLKDYAYREVGELKIGGKGDYNIAHPFVTADGNRIYFSSTMEGGYGGADIWYMDRDVRGNWGYPVNMGADVNTVGNEVFPYIWQNFFFFASDGHPGFGGLDLFVLPVRNAEQERPQNLGSGFNSSYDDFNLIVGSDGVSGLFVTNRVPEYSDDIYRFTLVRPLDRLLEAIRTGGEVADIVPDVEKKSDVSSYPEEWMVLHDTAVADGHTEERGYRMKVASGDVSDRGWWVQVAMLMQSRVIEYNFAMRVTELTGRHIMMFRGTDGGHRFYIGVYPTAEEARETVILLKSCGIDCFIKQVGKE